MTHIFVGIASPPNGAWPKINQQNVQQLWTWLQFAAGCLLSWVLPVSHYPHTPWGKNEEVNLLNPGIKHRSQQWLRNAWRPKSLIHLHSKIKNWIQRTSPISHLQQGSEFRSCTWWMRCAGGTCSLSRSSLLTGACGVSSGCHLFQQGGSVAKGSSALMLVLGGESCPSIWGQMSASTACSSCDLLCGTSGVRPGVGAHIQRASPGQVCFEEWDCEHPNVTL